MGAKKNEIIVGSLTDPIATFTNDDVQNVNSEQAVSLVGQELSIDTLSTTVLIDNAGKSNKKVVYCPRKTAEGYTIKELFGGGLRDFIIWDTTTADDFNIIYEIVLPTQQDFYVAPFVVADGLLETHVHLETADNPAYRNLMRIQPKRGEVVYVRNCPDEFVLEIEKNSKFIVKINGETKGEWDIEDTEIPQINRGNVLSFDSGNYAYCKRVKLYVNGKDRVIGIPAIRDSDNMAGIYNLLDDTFIKPYTGTIGTSGETQSNWSKGYVTAANKLYGAPYAFKLSDIPYASPIWWYNDEKLVGKFFFEKASRVSKNFWKLDAMSFVGVLDKQKHYGGVYNGQTFINVANEILGRSSAATTWYQAVDHITTDGTAWINTNVYPADNISVELIAKLQSLSPQSSSAKQWLFGSIETKQLQDYEKAVLAYQICAGESRYYAEQDVEDFVQDLMYEYEWTREQAEAYAYPALANAAIYMDHVSGWSYGMFETSATYQSRIHSQCNMAYRGTTLGTVNSTSEDHADLLSGVCSFFADTDGVIVSSYPGYKTQKTKQTQGYLDMFIRVGNLWRTGNEQSHWMKLSETSFDELKSTISITGTYPIYLCGVNTAGDSKGIVGENDVIHTPMDVYGTRIWRGDELIRDFRPCYRVSDNAVGMYEVKTGQFYTSIGSGEFTKGADVSSDIEVLNGKNHQEQQDDFSDIRVYGWLPIDSRRNNLYRLLFAHGVNLVKDDSGNLVFVKLTQIDEPLQIDDDRIYSDGSYEYEDAVNKIEITEHTYQGTDSARMEEIEPILLFDTSGQQSTSDELFVAFEKAPIIKASLATTGTLQILESGTNHAIIKGSGELWGKPYDHLTKVVTKSRELRIAEEEKLLTVDSCHLISLLNSSALMNRLWAFYTATETLKNSIVMAEEKCGDIVTLTDPFDEPAAGYMAKMSINASSINKADCEIIKGYSPSEDKYYENCVVLSGSGTWQLPEGVEEIRVIMIGGGEAGEAGTNGEAGETGSSGSKTFPGPTSGGDGGAGGRGGKVYQKTITNPSASYNFTCGSGAASRSATPGATTFGSYSSASGDYVPRGIVNLFTGEIYGAAGLDGVKGGNGGGYDSAKHEFVHSQNVVFKKQTYLGGDDGRLVRYVGFDGAYAVELMNDCRLTDGMGGGAAVGNNGANAKSTPPFSGNSGWNLQTPNPYPETYNGYCHCGLIFYGWTTVLVGYGGDGSNGANAVPGLNATQLGCGGNGGHGGGGGGHGGYIWASSRYQSIIAGGQAGQGGHGSAGGSGAAGCILIYY